MSSPPPPPKRFKLWTLLALIAFAIATLMWTGRSSGAGFNSPVSSQLKKYLPVLNELAATTTDASSMLPFHDKPPATLPVLHDITTVTPTAGLVSPSIPNSDRSMEKIDNAFSHILLVLVHAWFHHTASIDPIYRRYFWDILYLSPKVEGEKDKFLRHGFPVEVCARFKKNSVQFDFKSYACLGPVLQHILRAKADDSLPWDALLRKDGREHITGVLVAHSDFWITPSFANGMDFSKVWVVGGHSGFDIEQAFCKKVGDPGLNLNAWHWNPGLKDQYDQAAVKLKEIPSFATLRSNFYCGAWVDLYYLPRSSWTSWSKAVHIIRPYGIVNEIGVILAWRAMLQAGCQFQYVKCWGNYASRANLRVISDNPCGHKMELRTSPRVDRIRTSLIERWANETGVQ